MFNDSEGSDKFFTFQILTGANAQLILSGKVDESLDESRQPCGF